jgi:GAF domain-containing protein
MPDNEAERVAALKRTGILDTGPDPLFDQLTQMGARKLRMPTCLISLVDDDRQWFKSRVGMQPQSTPREIAFCDHAIRGNSVMIIPDATKDPRFANNPLVAEGIQIRFYAGAPIIHEGHNIGTFCVIDYKPNPTFSEHQVRMLEQLAQMTSRLLSNETPENGPDQVLL